jgi:UDP-3-O-[3-hydroxymyristoyl] glucosamine N-acyltransferase
MIDNAFHRSSGQYTLSELAEFTATKLHDESQGTLLIKNIAPIETASEGDITFLQNVKYTATLENLKASAIIIAEKFVSRLPSNIAAIISSNPYNTYAQIAAKFYPAHKPVELISPRAYIAPTAKIGQGTVVEANAYIGDNVQIGENCYIHANASISHAIIGNDCIIHHGAAIGQDGFGFAFNGAGYTKVPQLGRVIISDDVEVGANTTIDRGAAPDTIIGKGSKIDNLVQIAHNVKVGNYTVIAAQVGISGSTEIGSYCVIGGQVGIAGHLKIGNKVQIAAQSGVMRDIEDGAIIGGSPSVPIKQYHRQTVALEKLSEKKLKTQSN